MRPSVWPWDEHGASVRDEDLWGRDNLDYIDKDDLIGEQLKFELDLIIRSSIDKKLFEDPPV